MAFIKFVRGGYTTSPPLRDITGTMAAVEDGEDIFAATGASEGAPVTGTMAVQETGSDTFSAVGSVASAATDWSDNGDWASNDDWAGLAA